MQLQKKMDIAEQELIANEIQKAMKEVPSKLIDEVNVCSEMLESMHPAKRMASEVKDDDNFAEPLSKKSKIQTETPHHRIMQNKLESFRIKTIRECLHGIPPPPSLTNPRISIEEVVEKLEDYYGRYCKLLTCQVA
jgi:DNA topoisomerase VI subunit B